MNTPAKALSLDNFIAALPVERQEPARLVWEMVSAAVPSGYTEHVGRKYLEFRAGKEMCLALANQKSYLSLHLIPVYLMPGLRERLLAAAPKLKMGKGCLNFKRIDEVPLAALADVIAATPMVDFLAQMQAVRAASRR
ncbi:DUF1801 domain-containing protein [Hymenobacter properus]|uniref:DUF1801 domain-containing protein n=1 Tax=Hymenobacter properus TaxID=2791026 RepID=A0A931FKQ9_9BACT|nr:DUF1801 domain-containing protein [Hymenobacter properus]MBF9144192.1 DUF1801 domain-containing protein [Hymenobacter properus]MBR7723010.1 DUF1801 domain-containing protein [Microvirga sp. SRT04]